MPNQRQLRGLYVISDDTLTPDETLLEQVKQALRGGATIVQLRDKTSSQNVVKTKSIALQKLCHEYDALFVLNDKIDLAIELQCDGLHIGKSDHHRFDAIRKDFKGVLGVSCYGDLDLAKDFEKRGANYVAFGSFYTSPTKPSANIVPLEILRDAQVKLNIPICAIGGINTQNITDVMEFHPDMVSIVNDIWSAQDISSQSSLYANQF
jgi:thiamine-phosphate pyrophosphorylase